MPILCVDGEITDLEITMWEVCLPPTRVALTCDEVRAVFVGKPLSKAIALEGLTRVQLERLFPGRGQRKAAYNLIRFAKRIRTERARTVLQNASWHQLRAAAAHEDEEAQIQAAVMWIMGIRGPQPRRRSPPSSRVEESLEE